MDVKQAILGDLIAANPRFALHNKKTHGIVLQKVNNEIWIGYRKAKTNHLKT
jgi:hypothetical protein